MENKDNSETWKEKALQRRAENKELKKRIKEKEYSRDSWKQKYMVQKIELEKLKKEVELIKKKIENILKN